MKKDKVRAEQAEGADEVLNGRKPAGDSRLLDDLRPRQREGAADREGPRPFPIEARAGLSGQRSGGATR